MHTCIYKYRKKKLASFLKWDFLSMKMWCLHLPANGIDSVNRLKFFTFIPVEHCWFEERKQRPKLKKLRRIRYVINGFAQYEMFSPYKPLYILKSAVQNSRNILSQILIFYSSVSGQHYRRIYLKASCFWELSIKLSFFVLSGLILQQLCVPSTVGTVFIVLQSHYK